MTSTPWPNSRDNIDQDQFLTILSREDALARFEAALVLDADVELRFHSGPPTLAATQAAPAR